MSSGFTSEPTNRLKVNLDYASSSSFTKDAIEIDRNRLYFVSLPAGSTPPPGAGAAVPAKKSEAEQEDGRVEFCGTDEYVYQHFFADFGPPHLGHVYAFCQKLGRLLQHQPWQGYRKDDGKDDGDAVRPVYVYCSDHPHQRSNAAMLVLAYAVLCQGKTAEVAYEPFFALQPPLVPYRDAAFAICTYHLEVLECTRALARATSLRHVDLDSFNPESYAFYDKIENGDLNWIIPGKFLAFSGPLASRREVEPGKWTLIAEDYVPIFRELGVACVIRFNKKCYDRMHFVAAGIKHVDLFYGDGGNPSEAILQRFLRICEDIKGAIAVHCKAGLGRTGTNIALYMMKHYGYTAAESIALCRVCRPGSIVGPQQQFLHDLEQRMRREGDLYRQRPHQQQQRQQHRDSGATAHAQAEGIKPSWSLFSPVRRPQHQQWKQQYHARTDASSSGGGGTTLVTGDIYRPTTSPLLNRRRQSSEGSRDLGLQSGDAEARGGGAEGGSSFKRTIGGQPESGPQARTSDRMGSRNTIPWLTSGRSGGGGGVSGTAQGRRGRERSGSRESPLHRPRRASSPPGTAVNNRSDIRTMESIRGAGRRASSGWAAMIGGAGEGGPAGSVGSENHLVPLAVSLARPDTTRPGEAAASTTGSSPSVDVEWRTNRRTGTESFALSPWSTLLAQGVGSGSGSGSGGASPDRSTARQGARGARVAVDSSAARSGPVGSNGVDVRRAEPSLTGQQQGATGPSPYLGESSRRGSGWHLGGGGP